MFFFFAAKLSSFSLVSLLPSIDEWKEDKNTNFYIVLKRYPEGKLFPFFILDVAKKKLFTSYLDWYYTHYPLLPSAITETFKEW